MNETNFKLEITKDARFISAEGRIVVSWDSGDSTMRSEDWTMITLNSGISDNTGRHVLRIKTSMIRSLPSINLSDFIRFCFCDSCRENVVRMISFKGEDAHDYVHDWSAAYRKMHGSPDTQIIANND